MAAIGASLIGKGVAALVGSQLIGAVVSFGVSSLLSGALGGERKRDDQRAGEERGLLVNTASTVGAIPVVYGRRRVGGLRVFGPELAGDSNQFLVLVIVWGEGEIDAVEAVYIDELVSTNAHWTSDRYDPGTVVIYNRSQVGTDDQAADNVLRALVPSRWTTSHRLRGCAYTFLTLGWHEDKFTALPTITADIRGRKVHDPRSGITAWSDNPALCIRDYLTNTRYGRGIPSAAIDDDSFIEAANYCEQTVEVPDGAGGTTTQARYTCNGVVDTDRTPLDNLRELLSCCRGFLVFSAGVYQLRVDKAESATFAFSEDNIVGAWQIGMGDKRAVANRVRARFFNGGRRWQPDLAVVESTALRTADNGLLLEREIELPFTADIYRARQIAEQELKQSRQSITVSFRATIEALRCEVGDVVTITHTTPGWTAKSFRVLALRLLPEEEVEVTAREYDASVYTLNSLEQADAEPDTTLPDPLAVAAPGVPTAVESLYQTRDGAGVRSLATVTWEAAPDAFVREYELAWKLAAVATWRTAGRSPDTSFELLDPAPGLYDLRVRAFNALGVSSAWSGTGQVEIYGLSAPPSEPQNFTIQAAGGLAILRWDRSADLDVRVGGRIEFRHSPASSGATWVASATIGNAVSGDQTVAVLPLQPGTYLAKAVDAAGVRSTTAASVSTKGASLLAFSTLSTVTEHSAFSGGHSSTVASGGVLKLDSGGDVDALVDVDSVTNWDAQGGVVAAGIYTFATGMDLGVVKRVRLRTTLSVTQVDALSLLDDRAGNVDDWEDWDGDSAGAVADAQVWVRETDDDPAASPTWSAWQRLESGEFEARGFEFQCRLSTADSAYNVEVDQLSVTAEEVV